jgi:thiosulfate/3-mercaptopyruvate sulfurtransferase
VTYRFVDCRHDLRDPARGRQLYLAGHIPGAAFLDLASDLSGDEGGGRHPLPSADRFARAASTAGIGVGVFVVAHDDGGRAGAARLWWLLRHFGHDDVAVLDGGIGAWSGPLREGPEDIAPASFSPNVRGDDTMSADELSSRLDDPSLLILDARAPERYRGEVEPFDRIAGRIPGARNLPYTGVPPVPDDVLAAPELVVYCGSGVTACIDLLALSLAGRPDAKLYPGSWSDWSSRGLPVERG